MNLKRAFLIALAACILPGLALAQDGDLGTEVRFIVHKVYPVDTNETPVTVRLECNDGFVSQEGVAEIAPGFIGHTFIVTELTPFAPVICRVTEGDTPGYFNEYLAYNDITGDIDDNMCEYFYVGQAGAGPESGAGSAKTEADPVGEHAIPMDEINHCVVFNIPEPVEIKVSKDWDITNSGGNAVDMYAEIDVFAPIRSAMHGGRLCRTEQGIGLCMTLTFVGENPADQAVTVVPAYGGVRVSFAEEGVDSYVETENSCGGSVTVTPGDNSESCAFVNSVFFEGIPTLSQYGMAIMALLMLGVGFVGFRRFI